MSIVTVNTPFNIDLEFSIAQFHKRLLAWLIDIIIIYTYIYLMGRFVFTGLSMSEAVSDTIFIIFVILPALFYHLVLEILLNGQSIGKKALSIKVMDLEGNEATFSQYLIRWVFRLVDMGVSFGLGATLSAALTNNTQRLGDLTAGTVVIDQKYNTRLDKTIYLEIIDSNYVPMFPNVMRLTDRDINGIRNLLDVKKMDRDTAIYTEQVAERIKQVLGIETQLDSRELLQQLLQDYNFITHK
jgi:uncharacterized RDD family membrane protein YckC